MFVAEKSATTFVDLPDCWFRLSLFCLWHKSRLHKKYENLDATVVLLKLNEHTFEMSA